MSVVDGGPNTANIISRVQGILLRPREEWEKIDTEQATVPGLFTGYAMILAALPAIGGLIGQFLVHQNIVIAVVFAIVQYVLTLAGTFVFGLVVEALAPSFNSVKDRTQAMKVVVYSATAGWVGGIFNAIPFIGGLLALVAAIYSLVLLFLGLPRLMKTPEDKGMVYTIVAIVIYIVIFFVIAMIAGMVIAMMGAGAIMAGAAAGGIR